MLLVFDHGYLRSVARICWDHGVVNSEVRLSEIDKNGKLIDEIMNVYRLRCLGDV